MRAEGTALAEAHLAGYNATTGRHNRRLPGNGLSESWDIHESSSTSSYHLKLENSAAFQGTVTADVRKAMQAQAPSGGQHFPIRRPDGSLIWGASRYAELSGENLTGEGFFTPEIPCLISKTVGNGAIYYCATNLGEGAKADSTGLVQLLDQIAGRAGANPILDLRADPPGQVRVDLLENNRGPAFLTISNKSDQSVSIHLDLPGAGTGLFSGRRFQFDSPEAQQIPGSFIDLIVLEDLK